MTSTDWNKRFYELNPGAGKWNLKWDQDKQQVYLKGILKSGVGGAYKDPDNYPTAPSVIPSAPEVPSIPANVKVNSGEELGNALISAKATVAYLETLIAKQPK